MNYLSVDLETTGLYPSEHQILEFGAVYDNLTSPVDKLPTFRYVCVEDNYNISPFCAELHYELFKEINEYTKSGKTKENTVYGSSSELKRVFGNWLKCAIPGDQPIGKVIPAGKNFQGFDLPFLLKNNPTWRLLFSHRALDPGSMYVELEFPNIPSLPDILRSIGRTPTQYHTAVGDALDVVYAIRAKLCPEVDL